RDPPAPHSFPTRRSSDLRRYPWPGNIRELRNVLERAVLLSEKNLLQPQDLKLEAAALPLQPTLSPGDNGEVYSSNLTLEEVERRSEEHTSELQSPYDLVC